MTVKQGIAPENVFKVLEKHILVDGYDIVLDFEKSETPYLYDSKHNKRFLDFFTFFASNPLGLNHPKVVNDDDFKKKIGEIALHKPSNADIYTQAYAEFVETFDRVGIPDYLPHAFFISGGALAVENALKVAFDWKVQKNFEKGYRQEKGHKVLHLEKAFHGRTGYTMSLTNTLPGKVRYFPKFDWPRILNPKVTYPQTPENEQKVVKSENLAINQAERYFEMYKDDIACIILEPIQGEGGDNHFRLEFHKKLRELADKHDALLIYDEVQSGVGLTGKFWAHEHYVEPDIISFGKKSQVCGILAGKRVDEVPTNVFNVSSRINSTFGGNLVDMVRFQKYLEIIEEDNLVENAANVGDYLLKQIQDMTKKYDFVSNPRGKGLMCAFDFPSGHARKEFLDITFENGLLILPCGDTTVRFRPPLSIDKEHVDEGMEIIDKSIKAAIEKCPMLDTSGSSNGQS
ncbi:MAG TPA: L-lysine 6-transaminase [Balneolales bacterium]|nr:L-lysine 6-transaminase [Balneolales bacterium]